MASALDKMTDGTIQEFATGQEGTGKMFLHTLLRENMLPRRLWQLTGSGVWRVFSLALTLAVLLSGSWALYLGMQGLRPLDVARPTQSRFYPQAGDPAYAMSIPVRYLPDLQLQKHPDGTSELVTAYGQTTIEAPSSEVALVMVDVWESGDSPSGIEPAPWKENAKQFLDKCRERGVTIIHAPNNPVVRKYKQYRAIRAEVKSFLGRTAYAHTQLIRQVASGIGDYHKEVLYRWPTADFAKKYQDIRTQGKSGYVQTIPHVRT